MLKIEARENGFFIRTPCTICGNRERPGGIATYIIEDGESVGHVCERCERLDRDGLANQVKERASELECLVTALRELAIDILKPSTVITFPDRSVSEESLLRELSLPDLAQP